MAWYYAKGNQKRGPYSEIDFKKLVESGVVDLNTMVWREGMAAWQPLAKAAQNIPPALESISPEVVSSVKRSQCGESFPQEPMVQLSDLEVCAADEPTVLQKLKQGVQVRDIGKGDLENLLKAARSQKGILVNIWLELLLTIFVGVSLSAGVPPAIVAPIFLTAKLGLIISWAVYCYRLAEGLKMDAPILWALGVIFCCIPLGLIFLIVLFFKANTVLKGAGFNGGLMGGRIDDIEKAIWKASLPKRKWF